MPLVPAPILLILGVIFLLVHPVWFHGQHIVGWVLVIAAIVMCVWAWGLQQQAVRRASGPIQ